MGIEEGTVTLPSHTLIRIWVNILTAHFTYMIWLYKPNINFDPITHSVRTITIMLNVWALSTGSNSIRSTKLAQLQYKSPYQ